MRARGVTLVECVVALALVGIVIIASTVLIAAGPLALERQRANLDAVIALSNLLEGVHAGVVPLESGPVGGVPGGPGGTPVYLTLDVAPGSPAGVYEVTAIARYHAARLETERRLTTAVWRP